MGIRVNAGLSRSELCHCAVPHASCSATHRKQEVIRERLAAQPAVPEDVKSERPRKSRERKRSKRLKRQQPERKEKYRERQCRANRKQHYKLSKPSARHDMRNANATSVTYFPPNSHGRGAFAGRVKRREWW